MNSSPDLQISGGRHDDKSRKTLRAEGRGRTYGHERVLARQSAPAWRRAPLRQIRPVGEVPGSRPHRIPKIEEAAFDERAALSTALNSIDSVSAVAVQRSRNNRASQYIAIHHD